MPSDQQVYSRDIAFIYYLTKDWSEEDGGHLIDYEGGDSKFLPEFNSAVAFKVPRYHAVLPPTGDKPRYKHVDGFGVLSI
jgi:Rps23 Pro-64 3,4-dihydroxylase Tpa1-like proline 4-hydroxylase